MFAFVIATLLSMPVQAELAFHWQDDFSPAEQQKLEVWLTETQEALEQLVGKLPFVTHLYMNRTNAGEPVPWANTERSAVQGVHFHVDPSYSLQEFRDDWTAPHELSHLVLPYVGRQYSWFAEGFASYMQYQVMHKMGVLSTDAMKKRYARNLNKAAGRYRHDSMPFAYAAPKLRAERNYPTMYWGGAAFFLQADDQLMATGKPGLMAALKQYTLCCRMRGHKLDDVIASLDKLTGTNALSELLATFRNRKGFPKHRDMDMGPSTPHPVTSTTTGE